MKKFVDQFRQARANLTAPESVATLCHMEDHLRSGQNWVQNVYRQGNALCLVGAAEKSRVSSIDDAKHWLRQAVAERTGGGASIEEFNDGAQSFAEIADVVARARQLATAHLPVPVAPRGAVEIIPPARLTSVQPNSWVSPAQHEIPAEPDKWADFEPGQHDRVTAPDPDRSVRRKLADWMFD